MGKADHFVCAAVCTAQYFVAEVPERIRFGQKDAVRVSVFGYVEYLCGILPVVQRKFAAVFAHQKVLVRIVIPEFERLSRKPARVLCRLYCGLEILRGVFACEQFPRTPIKADPFKIIGKVCARRKGCEVNVQFGPCFVGRIRHARPVFIAVAVFKRAPKTGIAAFDVPPRQCGRHLFPVSVFLVVIGRCRGGKSGKFSARRYAAVHRLVELRPHIVGRFRNRPFRYVHHVTEFVCEPPSVISCPRQYGRFPRAFLYADVFPERICRRPRLHDAHVYVDIGCTRVVSAVRRRQRDACKIQQGKNVIVPVFANFFRGNLSVYALCLHL